MPPPVPAPPLGRRGSQRLASLGGARSSRQSVLAVSAAASATAESHQTVPAEASSIETTNVPALSTSQAQFSASSGYYSSVLPPVIRKPFPRALIVHSDKQRGTRMFVGLTSKRFCATNVANPADGLAQMKFPPDDFDVVFVDCTGIAVKRRRTGTSAGHHSEDSDQDSGTSSRPPTAAGQTAKQLLQQQPLKKSSNATPSAVTAAAANKRSDEDKKQQKSQQQVQDPILNPQDANNNNSFTPLQFAQVIRMRERQAEMVLGRGPSGMATTAGSNSGAATLSTNFSAKFATSERFPLFGNGSRVGALASLRESQTERERVMTVRDGISSLTKIADVLKFAASTLGAVDSEEENAGTVVEDGDNSHARRAGGYGESLGNRRSAATTTRQRSDVFSHNSVVVAHAATVEAHSVARSNAADFHPSVSMNLENSQRMPARPSGTHADSSSPLTIQGAVAHRALTATSRHIVIAVCQTPGECEYLEDLGLSAQSLGLERYSALLPTAREAFEPLFDAVLKYPFRQHLDALEATFVAPTESVAQFIDKPSLGQLTALLSDVTQRRVGGLLRVVDAPDWRRLTEAVACGNQAATQALLQPIPRLHVVEKTRDGVSNQLTIRTVDDGLDIGSAMAHSLYRAQSDVRRVEEQLQLEKQSVEAIDSELEIAHKNNQDLTRRIEECLEEQHRLEAEVEFLNDQLSRKEEECRKLRAEATDALDMAQRATDSYDAVMEAHVQLISQRARTDQEKDDRIARARLLAATGRTASPEDAASRTARRESIGGDVAIAEGAALQQDGTGDGDGDGGASRRASPVQGAALSSQPPQKRPGSGVAKKSPSPSRPNSSPTRKRKSPTPRNNNTKSNTNKNSSVTIAPDQVSAQRPSPTRRRAKNSAFRNFNAAQFLQRQEARCIEVDVGIAAPLYLDLLSQSRSRCLTYMRENVKLRQELFETYSVIFDYRNKKLSQWDDAGVFKAGGGGGGGPAFTTANTIGLTSVVDNFFASFRRVHGVNNNAPKDGTNAIPTPDDTTTNSKSVSRTGGGGLGPKTLSRVSTAREAVTLENDVKNARRRVSLGGSVAGLADDPSNALGAELEEAKRVRSDRRRASLMARRDGPDDFFSAGDENHALGAAAAAAAAAVSSGNYVSRSAEARRWRRRLQIESQNHERSLMERADVISALTIEDNVFTLVKDCTKFKAANLDYNSLKDVRLHAEFADSAVTSALDNTSGQKTEAAAAAATAAAAAKDPIASLQRADAEVVKTSKKKKNHPAAKRKAVSLGIGGSGGAAGAVVHNLVVAAQQQSQEPVRAFLQQALAELWASVKAVSQTTMIDVMTTHSAVGHGLDRLLASVAQASRNAFQAPKAIDGVWPQPGSGVGRDGSPPGSARFPSPQWGGSGSPGGGANNTTNTPPGSSAGQSRAESLSSTVVGLAPPIRGSSAGHGGPGSSPIRGAVTIQHQPGSAAAAAAPPPLTAQQQQQLHAQAVAQRETVIRQQQQLAQALKRLLLDRLVSAINKMVDTLGEKFSAHVFTTYVGGTKTIQDAVLQAVRPVALENTRLAAALLVAKTAAHNSLGTGAAGGGATSDEAADFGKAIATRDGWCQTKPVIIKDPGDVS